MDIADFLVNEDKELIVGSGADRFYCFAIKTKVVTVGDKLGEILDQYARPLLEEGDILFIAEKMISCLQGRAIPLEEIKPGFWARFLSRRVTKNPGGIGLAMPETMQCAIDECGLLRILFASVIGVIGKLFGRKGWFYHVAGYKAASIDGPCHWTIPPYNRYVVLGPRDPDQTALEASRLLGGATVLIVDLNDLGGQILGASAKNVDKAKMLELLTQNPLGQTDESTPMGILRPCNERELGMRN